MRNKNAKRPSVVSLRCANSPLAIRDAEAEVVHYGGQDLQDQIRRFVHQAHRAAVEEPDTILLVHLEEELNSSHSLFGASRLL